MAAGMWPSTRGRWQSLYWPPSLARTGKSLTRSLGGIKSLRPSGWLPRRLILSM
ncbi:hypothetical protein LINPERHAP1_LOCUS6333 [Linum perenne]